MKKYAHWLFFLILFPFSIIIILTFYIAKKVICPPISGYVYQHLTSLVLDQHKHLKDMAVDVFFISSHEGYPLRCRYYSFDYDKTVVLCHGWTSNLYEDLKHIPMFYRLGFNVLLFDQRYHGESGGACTTFGYYEKEDLKKIVDWVSVNKKPSLIGLYGKSMGASTIIQYLPMTQLIDFAIVDCPYSDLYEQFTNVLSLSYPFLPCRTILFIADIFFKVKGKFSVKKVRPLKDMEAIDIPMLIIHGDKDFFVPTVMSHQLYQAKRDKKHLLIMPNAAHSKAFDVNPEFYEKVVKEFLSTYNFI